MPSPQVLTKSQIEQVFDGSASIYDRSGPGIFKRFGRRLTEMLQIPPGITMLDVATGTGAVLIPAARQIGTPGRVFGIDISLPILVEAEKEVSRLGLTNVELTRMDAEALNFSDSAFDLITCAFALFMFPDVNLALREMHRVAKPGASIGVTYFARTPPPFDPGWKLFAQLSTEYGVARRMPQQLGLEPDELKSLLESNGFRPTQLEAEHNDITYPGYEDWWGMIMTLGSRNAVLSLDEARQREFKEAYLTRLLPSRSEDGFHMHTGVLYCVAERI